MLLPHFTEFCHNLDILYKPYASEVNTVKFSIFNCNYIYSNVIKYLVKNTLVKNFLCICLKRHNRVITSLQTMLCLFVYNLLN